ncbi:MAG TPA: SAM-dependent methyltransferase [Polyangiaceae bacterium]|nr:SAM-dependent methyltransferase [Polyangiaceae bacterium]
MTSESVKDRGSLVIVGTGIQWSSQMSAAARKCISSADRVLYALVDETAANFIRGLNPNAASLPYPLDRSLRRDTYRSMADAICAPVRAGERVCAVFYGHPGVLATAAHLALRELRRDGYPARMLPAISAFDCLLADLSIDPGQAGCQIYEATDFLKHARIHDPRVPLVLMQVGAICNPGFFNPLQEEVSSTGLDVLVTRLEQQYPARLEVVLYEASADPAEESAILRLPLRELRNADVSDLSTLYVPPIETAIAGVTAAGRASISSAL